MEGWVREKLEEELGYYSEDVISKIADSIINLLTPEIRKDTLKEVAGYLEREAPYFADINWVSIQRLKAGMLP